MAARHVFRTLLFVYVVLAILAFVQVRRTRRIYHMSCPEEGDWRGKAVEFVLGKPGQFHGKYPMVGRAKKGPHAGVNPALQVRLPARRSGYALNIGAALYRFRNPPMLRVFVNDACVGEYQPRKSREQVNGEIEIPARMLRDRQANYLRVENDSTGGWVGTLLLIPYAPMHRILRVCMPLFAAVMLVLLGWMKGRHWTWLRPTLAGLFVFPVYMHSLMSWKLTPLGGMLFSDSDELVLPLFQNEMSFDMMKHMLYLPVMHGLWAVFHNLGQPEMVALVLASAVVSALNVVAAHLWFRRVVRSEQAAMLWTVVYAFAFAVWVCSSIYETFILSSLMVNLVLLGLTYLDRNAGVRHHAVVALLMVLAGTAHPPLLVLLGLYLAKLAFLPVSWRRKCVTGAAVVATVVAGFFLAGQAFYALYSGQEGWFGNVSFARDTVGNYASTEHFNLQDSGNIFLGQFVHALVGRRPGFDWAGGWHAILDWRGHPGSAVATVSWVCVFVAGIIGLVRNRAWRWKALTAVTVVLVPYLGFLWYFNPGEMILYSSPLVSLVLGAIAAGSGDLLSRRETIWLGVLAVAIVMANTFTLAAYA